MFLCGFFSISPCVWQFCFECILYCIVGNLLTHKQLETHGFVLSNVATDDLVLKHWGISIHSAD